MSSLAAARADGYYYPPEWTPDKGSKNTFQKSHALGVRAKKIGQGIIVIRFELPYDSWCLGCGRHIGRGVRYNAEKKKVGMYFTTIIYEFQMKCATCPQKFVIQTDPEHRDYKFVSGIKKKMEEFTAEQAGTERVDSNETQQAIANDPLFKLEHGGKDEKIAKARAPALERLQELQASRMEDDFSANSVLRRAHRTRKREEAEEEREARGRCMFVPGLLPADTSDSAAAAAVTFRPPPCAFADGSRKRKLEVRSAPIFDGSSSSSSNSRALVSYGGGTGGGNGSSSSSSKSKGAGVEVGAGPRQHTLGALAKQRECGIDPRHFSILPRPGEKGAVAAAAAAAAAEPSIKIVMKKKRGVGGGGGGELTKKKKKKKKTSRKGSQDDDGRQAQVVIGRPGSSSNSCGSRGSRGDGSATACSTSSNDSSSKSSSSSSSLSILTMYGGGDGSSSDDE